MRDIQEARKYGISLGNDVSLNQLYSLLADARKQKSQFEKKHPKGSFKYDDGEDEQPPSDDGIDEVERNVRAKNTKRKSRSKRR